MNQQTNSFYTTLFNKGDLTAFGDSFNSKMLSDAINTGKKENNAFFSINPQKTGGTRSDSNVAIYRNFLFEIDGQTIDGEPNQKVSEADQQNIMKDCILPFTTCVHSGNKSLHWIVSLADDTWITDPLEYEAIWKAIASIIRKSALKLGIDTEADYKCKNPSRSSRAANALRTDKVEKPTLQVILKVRHRIDTETLLDWFKHHEVEWYDFMPKRYETNLNVETTASEQERIDWCFNVGMKNELYQEGNRHNYQVKLVYLMLRTGLTHDVCDRVLKEKFGEISTGIGKTTAKIKAEGQPIHVWSREEKKAWAQEQERLRAEPKPLQINQNEVADVNQGGLANYIRVGTKYYRPTDKDILLWSKDTIKDDFGARALNNPLLRKFIGFANEPNYLERVEFVNRNENGQTVSYYNKFFYPNWELKKGEFPTIMKLLKKVFVGESEDQLEIGLDWIQLMITQPKQKLRSLVLVGPSETGKDTFMEWLCDIVGSNGVILGGQELESQYNTIWAGKHLVCLNEVNYDIHDKKTKEKLKDILTAKHLTVEGKGDNRYQIENHNKVVMATNNMYDFMQISSTENRFHVREMTSLKDEDKDSNFKTKLTQESPHFLYWIIKERQLWRPSKDDHGNGKGSRFWHSDKECYTEAGNRVVENTKSTLYTELLSLFETQFNHSNLRDSDVMYVRSKTITHVLNLQQDRRNEWSQKAVNMCLLKEFGIKDHKTIRHDAFDEFQESNNRYFEIPRSLIEGTTSMPMDYFKLLL